MGYSLTAMNKTSQIIDESLRSFRSRAALLTGKLEIATLYGQGYMILADAKYPSGNSFALVWGSFDRPGYYAPNVARSFCALDIVPDHLCGISLYSPESAEKVIAQMTTRQEFAELSNFRLRHIRAEQERRLALCRDMVKTLEDAARKV